MSDDTLPKTLTLTQALNGVTNEWRVGSTFNQDNTTKFLERVKTVGAIFVEKPKEEEALPGGLNRDRVAVELLHISWRSARAALGIPCQADSVGDGRARSCTRRRGDGDFVGRRPGGC